MATGRLSRRTYEAGHTTCDGTGAPSPRGICHVSPAPTALLVVMAVAAYAQPPLPPQERPSKLGTVLTVSETDGLALEDGTAAPLAEGVRLEGVQGLEELGPGDLVEVVQDDNGLVSVLRVVPRLADWKPMLEVAQAGASASRFWWQHEGRDFPDSVYAADLQVTFASRVSALSATAAYVPKTAQGPVRFVVLDHTETVIWEKSLAPGETAELTCPLPHGASVTLQCRRVDGSVPDHTHCVWGSPSVLMRGFGSITLAPAAADDIVAGLAESLGQVDPGRLVVAMPRTIGLAAELGKSLQEDLLVALARRYVVAGAMTQASGKDLTDTDVQAAQSLEAETVAASEIRYAEDGSTIHVTLVDATTRETLARAETKLKP